MTYTSIPSHRIVQILRHLPGGHAICGVLDLPVSKALDSTATSATLDTNDTSATRLPGLPGLPVYASNTPHNRHEIRRKRKLDRLWRPPWKT